MEYTRDLNSLMAPSNVSRPLPASRRRAATDAWQLAASPKSAQPRAGLLAQSDLALGAAPPPAQRSLARVAPRRGGMRQNSRDRTQTPPKATALPAQLARQPRPLLHQAPRSMRQGKPSAQTGAPRPRLPLRCRHQVQLLRNTPNGGRTLGGQRAAPLALLSRGPRLRAQGGRECANKNARVHVGRAAAGALASAGAKRKLTNSRATPCLQRAHAVQRPEGPPHQLKTGRAQSTTPSDPTRASFSSLGDGTTKRPHLSDREMSPMHCCGANG